ncbi:hypothetical protein DFA_07107 [Cavenderia fasciculata]|uniref:E2F-associated phosphoprotein n=1 Tax=Cavenderia fasciculata TaxID=261658 RepID=F4PVH8_CACFS|nr:uncharacterized protein DFA_07107 [Cavenderia fasciculata]EGG19992.1 hypothetical protein DFA_07107 [Cavenderia fasciculata]|eukprot:XP_004366975.1 hypothetical protein DFA_07107 [Cavenderia fasciculata]
MNLEKNDDLSTKSSSRRQQQQQRLETIDQHSDDEFQDDESSDEDGDDSQQVGYFDTKDDFTEEERNELLYDDKEDDLNQQWVDKNLKSTNKTDAYLSCPACFTLLCVDCQRHDLYKNQYRAMFVKNCTIDYQSKLVYKEEKKKHPKKSKGKGNGNGKEPTSIATTDDHDNDDQQIEEDYYSVECSNCTTKVAVYDKDEIYHFFNVFPSNS